MEWKTLWQSLVCLSVDTHADFLHVHKILPTVSHCTYMIAGCLYAFVKLNVYNCLFSPPADTLTCMFGLTTICFLTLIQTLQWNMSQLPSLFQCAHGWHIWQLDVKLAERLLSHLGGNVNAASDFFFPLPYYHHIHLQAERGWVFLPPHPLRDISYVSHVCELPRKEYAQYFRWCVYWLMSLAQHWQSQTCLAETRAQQLTLSAVNIELTLSYNTLQCHTCQQVLVGLIEGSGLIWIWVRCSDAFPVNMQHGVLNSSQ